MIKIIMFLIVISFIALLSRLMVACVKRTAEQLRKLRKLLPYRGPNELTMQRKPAEMVEETGDPTVMMRTFMGLVKWGMCSWLLFMLIMVFIFFEIFHSGKVSFTILGWKIG